MGGLQIYSAITNHALIRNTAMPMGTLMAVFIYPASASLKVTKPRNELRDIHGLEVGCTGLERGPMWGGVHVAWSLVTPYHCKIENVPFARDFSLDNDASGVHNGLLASLHRQEIPFELPPKNASFLLLSTFSHTSSQPLHPLNRIGILRRLVEPHPNESRESECIS